VGEIESFVIQALGRAAHAIAFRGVAAEFPHQFHESGHISNWRQRKRTGFFPKRR
jgi:hypothetical protein